MDTNIAKPVMNGLPEPIPGYDSLNLFVKNLPGVRHGGNSQRPANQAVA